MRRRVLRNVGILVHRKTLEKVGGIRKECLERLKVFGSAAAPGHMTPEGIIIYHTAANAYFKATINKDEEPKGKTK